MEKQFVLQGSVAATFVAFLQASVLRMIPYAIPTIALIALDLVYGIKAAKDRGERVRLSTALRKTTTKFFSYVCWIILASTMALAFNVQWIEWIVLGTVYANELASVVGNYLETKGLELSWGGVVNALVKLFGRKHGINTEDIDANEILKPIKQGRNKKGQFVSRKKVQ